MTRVGNYVDFNQPGFLARFSVPFGGAPLEWYMTENGQRISVVSQPSGEGAQLLWDTGQDWTQSTGTGLNGNIVKRLDTVYMPGSEYYIREEAYLPDRDGHEALYQVGGNAPAFMISVDRIDDEYLPDPRITNNSHLPEKDKWFGQWSTKYHDILNLGSQHYHQLGTPIYFCPYKNVTSGMIFPGDTIRQQYYPQINNGAQCPFWYGVARIENGHCALRMRVSMKNAIGNAMGGFMFGIQKELSPSDTIHTVWASPWSAVFVNVHGGVDFWDNGRIYPVVPNGTYAAQARSQDGVLLDIRTLDNKVEVWIEGAKRGTFTRSCFGPYCCFFSSGDGGQIAFRHRELFDVGANFTAQYRTTARNTLYQRLSVFRVKPPYHIPAYRMNLPVQFVDPAIRDTAQRWDKNNNEVSPVDLTKPGNYPLMKDTKAIYTGRADGSAGLFGLIRGYTYSGEEDLAHVGVDALAMGFNNLPFSANHVPQLFNCHTIESEWAPRRRLELLND